MEWEGKGRMREGMLDFRLRRDRFVISDTFWTSWDVGGLTKPY